MPSANKTPNYNLTQYSNNGSDKISALQDYNTDMSKIDTALNDNANNITAKADANTTYNKTDIDNKLGVKANASDVYSKEDINKKYTNVVELGADNTGASDVADKIQDIVNNSPYGVHFPNGIYSISHSINFPYNTQETYGITLDQGATIVASNSMDYMFGLGAFDAKKGVQKEGFSICGGNFNANDKAAICIKTSENIRQSRISNVDVRYFTSTGIYVDAVHTNDSSDTLVSNIRVNRVQTPHHIPNTTGILFVGPDNVVDCAYIADCGTGIKTNGLVQIGTIHIFCDQYWSNNNNPTCGISSGGGLLAHSIYLDSLDVGVECKYMCAIDSIFIYNYFPASGRIYFKVMDACLDVTFLKAGGNVAGDKYIQFIKDDLSVDDRLSLSYKIHSEIEPTQITDGAALTNRDTTYRRKVFFKQQTIPAYSGILIGYLTKPSDSYLGGGMFTISTDSGYEFYMKARVNAPHSRNTTTNRLQMEVFEKDPDFDSRIAVGVEEDIGLSNQYKVYPLYVYKSEEWQSYPTFFVKVDMPFNFNAGIIYSQGDSPKIVALTRDNTILTSETGGGL